MRLITYVLPTAQTWNPMLNGLPVMIRATPLSYEWDYGDGTDPLSTSDPGAPFPRDTVSHTYTQPAEVEVTLTTTYTGVYSTDGGATWLAVPGTATTEPIPISVVEARAQLVSPDRR